MGYKFYSNKNDEFDILTDVIDEFAECDFDEKQDGEQIEGREVQILNS